jgi:hypothetical protein
VEEVDFLPLLATIVARLPRFSAMAWTAGILSSIESFIPKLVAGAVRLQAQSWLQWSRKSPDADNDCRTGKLFFDKQLDIRHLEQFKRLNPQYGVCCYVPASTIVVIGLVGEAESIPRYHDYCTTTKIVASRLGIQQHAHLKILLCQWNMQCAILGRTIVTVSLVVEGESSSRSQRSQNTHFEIQPKSLCITSSVAQNAFSQSSIAKWASVVGKFWFLNMRKRWFGRTTKGIDGFNNKNNILWPRQSCLSQMKTWNSANVR